MLSASILMHYNFCALWVLYVSYRQLNCLAFNSVAVNGEAEKLRSCQTVLISNTIWFSFYMQTSQFSLAVFDQWLDFLYAYIHARKFE